MVVIEAVAVELVWVVIDMKETVVQMRRLLGNRSACLRIRR